MSLALRRRLGLALALLTLTGDVWSQQLTKLSTDELQEAWRQVGGKALASFQGDRLLCFEKDLLIVGIVRRQAPDVLVVRHEGQLEIWKAVVRDGLLQLGKGANTKVYKRLPEAPPSVTLRPVVLKPRPLAQGRIEGIQKEVAARFQRDQEVRKATSEASKQVAINEENHKYLRALVEEVGWLDTARFGEKTSVYAIILLKHSGDLPLELAALPYAERDLKLRGEGQTYAVLYDDVQLLVGGKQKYGTQVANDTHGNPYVLPLEDPARVDAYLKELGLPPLSNYLADLSKFAFGGKPIRFATPEESE